MTAAHRIASFAVVFILAFAGVVTAEPGALLVGGRASDHDQRVATEAVTSTLTAAGWTLARKSYPASTFTPATACAVQRKTAWTCISGLLGDKQVDRVAIVKLDPKPGGNGNTDIELSARLVVAAPDLFVALRTCNGICTPDRLRTIASELTKDLLDRAVRATGHSAIVVTSTPIGAFVTINSSLVGTTEFSAEFAPGPYTVTVELAGYKRETRHVTLREGKTEPIEITLVPAEASAPNPNDGANTGNGGRSNGHGQTTPAKRLTPLVPIGIAAVGIGLGVAAIVQYARDEDDAPPGRPVPPTYNDTAAQVPWLAAGSAIVIGGAAFVWWKWSRPKSSSTPIAAPTPGGAVIGWVQSF